MLFFLEFYLLKKTLLGTFPLHSSLCNWYTFIFQLQKSKDFIFNGNFAGVISPIWTQRNKDGNLFFVFFGIFGVFGNVMCRAEPLYPPQHKSEGVWALLQLWGPQCSQLDDWCCSIIQVCAEGHREAAESMAWSFQLSWGFSGFLKWSDKPCWASDL